ncbi:MAG: HAD hydrolase-like protein [Oscillospiraceae bacterium]|nr:HAD hydrolase-like protein [Oscillospiraceae bacterium]
MYENILFDLDGTVTESAPGIFQSIRYAMDRMNVPLPDSLDMSVFIGPPLTVSFRSILGLSESDADRAVSFYREYYGDRGLFECRVYPGVPELLTRLRAEGRTVALATAKPETFSRRILDHFGLTDRFTFIGGASLDASRRTKDAVIAHVLPQLPGAFAENTIMVGDRDQDVTGARNNGIGCIGVLYGYGSAEELAGAGALALAEDCDELYLRLCE